MNEQIISIPLLVLTILFLYKLNPKYCSRCGVETIIPHYQHLQNNPNCPREHGDGSLETALENVEARTLLICFSSDWLYPPEDSRALADALEANGKPVELHIIEAPYGHDSFLLEEARQIPLIRKFLAQ